MMKLPSILLFMGIGGLMRIGCSRLTASISADGDNGRILIRHSQQTPSEARAFHEVRGGINVQQPTQIAIRRTTSTKHHVRKMSEEPTEESSSSSVSMSGKTGWKCCVDPSAVESIHKHPTAEEAQESKNYACPDHPSDFRWYYQDQDAAAAPPTRSFDRHEWKKLRIVFVGGSTQRQMYEQYRWELPYAASHSQHNYEARFLFTHHEGPGGCCAYDRSDILDTRTLQADLVKQLQEGPDYVVINVGLWWGTKAVGTVIDEHGTWWSIKGTPKNKEWRIANNTDTSTTTATTKKPNVSFAKLMKRAIHMMQEIKQPHTKIVWRSESSIACDPALGWQGTIAPVLEQAKIPVLNISQATCDYLAEREDYDKQQKGPHLCFPSVALRHWLLEFQDQFIIAAAE